MTMRAFFSDSPGGINKVHRIIVMLFHPCRNRQDVQVKDYILREEIKLLGEEVVGTLRYAHFFIYISGLTLLIKGHDNHCSPVLLDLSCLLKEVLFTLLQRDRIHYAFALSILEASLDDLELGGVDHHGYISDLRVGLKKAHELGHGLLAVDKAVVQVDVEDLSAVLDLVLGHLQGGFIVSLLDQLFELDTARDVASLTHIYEGDDWREEELGQT